MDEKMSQENAKKFMELINSENGSLSDKLKSRLDNFNGDKKDEKAVFEAVLAPVAKEAGYNL